MAKTFTAHLSAVYNAEDNSDHVYVSDEHGNLWCGYWDLLPGVPLGPAARNAWRKENPDSQTHGFVWHALPELPL